MDKYYELCTHPLFKNFSEKNLKTLVPLFKEYSCDEGAVIYYQKDGADSLYIFIEGEYCASTSGGDNKKFYLKGDYTDPQNLFGGEKHNNTLICRSSGKYLKLNRSDFLGFYSDLKRNDRDFKLLFDEHNRLISGLNLNPDLSKDNEPVNITRHQWRRSSFFLFEKLFYPFLLLMIVLFFQAGSFTFQYDSIVYKTITLFILIYSFVRLILWLSELFILTEKNISAVKISFRPLGIKRNLLPLDQVRGIKIEKKKLKNRFFNIGSILIQTPSGTVLQLSDIDRPQAVQVLITDSISRSIKYSDNRERVEIRKKMESYFESKQIIRSTEDDTRNEEEESTVIFNKSLFFLISNIWWQICIIAALVFFIYLFRDSRGGLFVIPGLPFLSILLWRIQDWRNDLYKVVDGKIIDINKKPFGKSESNNLADIGFVTNIRSERKGLLQYLFNYGDVLIETAGGSIRFETVSSPLNVQSRLLQLRESWKEKEEKKKRNQQFQDFLVYSEIYKQEEEQNRIGRSTPLPAENILHGVNN